MKPLTLCSPEGRMVGQRLKYLLGALGLVLSAGDASAQTTLYVGKHFEVRKHDAPVKYVFNGNIRVARVTGSLSANERIQRLRLRDGWNLISLAVTAPAFLNQLRHFTEGPAPVIQALYRWQPATKNFGRVTSGETVVAGTVLWISTRTNAIVAVRGGYVEPAQWSVPAGETFVATPALEAQPLTVPEGVTIWRYDARDRRWQAGLPGDIASLSNLPSTLAPGEAIYVHSIEPTDLGLPAREERLRYYHQDHLGSSSVMTDSDGALVEEAAFYPFGIPRHEHRVRQVDEAYKFTQKERDRESGLNYFEARYLAGGMSRFLSVDPKYANTDAAAGDPQAMNLYAYVVNNPLRHTDPTGLEPATDYSKIANDIAVVETEAAKKSDGASFAAGVGDKILGAVTLFPSFFFGAPGMLGGFNVGPSFEIGPSMRKAFGIENVDEDSRVYAGGGIAWTMVEFASGGVRGGASVPKSLSKGNSVVDPMAKTPFVTDAYRTTQAAVSAPKIVPKGAATGLSTGGGASAIRVSQAADAAVIAQQSAYMKIISEIQYSLMHLEKSGVHPSRVMNMAFQQADAVWMSRFGTKPPGLR